MSLFKSEIETDIRMASKLPIWCESMREVGMIGEAHDMKSKQVFYVLLIGFCSVHWCLCPCCFTCIPP